MKKIPTKRILIYVAFIAASVFVIILFVTATTYTQLALAVILYPAIAFVALKIFSKKSWIMAPVPPHAATVSFHRASSATMDVLDVDKRTFLKLVGATGVFFFLTSLAGKWAGSLPWGKAIPQLGNGNSAIGNAEANGSLTANGYQIAEIDEGATSYYGFTNPNGSWLIMKEDTSTSSFRYARGNSSFPANWTARQNLKYDYYYNLF